MLGSLWVPRGKKTPFNNRFIRMERTSWFERLLNDEFLTLKEVAGYLMLMGKTVRGVAAEGKLPI